MSDSGFEFLRFLSPVRFGVLVGVGISKRKLGRRVSVTFCDEREDIFFPIAPTELRRSCRYSTGNREQ